MLVKAIPAPVEARDTWFGSAGCFLSVSRNVAAYTHVVDPYAGGWAVPQPSVWAVLPFGRDVLIAACMLAEGDDWHETVELTADETRDWALGCLMYLGVERCKVEASSPRFQHGYDADANAAWFFQAISAQLDDAFGFAEAAASPPPAATRTAPARLALAGAR